MPPAPPRKPARPAHSNTSQGLPRGWVAIPIFLIAGMVLSAWALTSRGPKRSHRRDAATENAQPAGLLDRVRTFVFGDDSAKKGESGEGGEDGSAAGEKGSASAGSRGGSGGSAVGVNDSYRSFGGQGGLRTNMGGAGGGVGGAGDEGGRFGAGGSGGLGGSGGGAGGSGGTSGAPGSTGSTNNDNKTPSLDAGVRDPNSDTTPPTLVGVVFDPAEVKDGSPTNARLEVTDDISGVASVNGSISSPSGATVYFTAQRVGDANVWTAPVQIPKDGEAGNWCVSLLSLTDKAANTSTKGYQAAQTPGCVRVTSSASDTQPPQVRLVSLAKSSLAAGDANVVIVDVTDDKSGVASVYGTFESANKSGLLAFAAQAGGPNQPWTGQLPIPADAACGVWHLRELHLVDVANNRADLNEQNPAVARATFSIYPASGGKCDSEAPVVRNVTVSPSQVLNAVDTPITILIDVSDDSSGVASVSGYVSAPKLPGVNTMIGFSATPTGDGNNSPWSATVVMPAKTPKGSWKVGYLQVADKARNIRYLNEATDQVLSRSTFDVR